MRIKWEVVLIKSLILKCALSLSALQKIVVRNTHINLFCNDYTNITLLKKIYQNIIIHAIEWLANL